ncbi:MULTISPECIES: RNA polymerase sigma factor [Methylosinus]|uniref:RNA polymerase sigma factor n=1 Tax=Methylosinus TaxID=425 RepID=UPI0012DD6ED8|nr:MULTISPECIES: RNA polymerase sigma factor [Methylosinus]
MSHIDDVASAEQRVLERAHVDKYPKSNRLSRRGQTTAARMIDYDDACNIDSFPKRVVGRERLVILRDRGFRRSSMQTRRETLEDLYRAHAPDIRRYACRRLGSQESEDLVHDVYLRMLQDAHNVSLDCPRAFLFRVASNHMADLRRKKKLHSRVVDEAAEVNSSGIVLEATIEGLMAFQKLKSSLAGLSTLCRDMLLLKSFEELSNEEIAIRLGVSTRTVERRLARARSELRLRCGP